MWVGMGAWRCEGGGGARNVWVRVAKNGWKGWKRMDEQMQEFGNRNNLMFEDTHVHRK